MAPRNITAAIGVQYFRQTGHHLVDPQPRQRPANPHHEGHAEHALADEVEHPQQIAEVPEPASGPIVPAGQSQANRVIGNGPFQPPKNKMAASPLTANIEPYSAMKKSYQRRPEYSVWKPATSSLSASARSNGARFTLAVAQVK